MTLKGERKEEKERKGENFHAIERRYGSFHRMIEFPTEVNAGDASVALKDGVLELTVPKAKHAKPKQIQSWSKIREWVRWMSQRDCKKTLLFRGEPCIESGTGLRSLK